MQIHASQQTRILLSVDLMLGQRRRCWANIESKLSKIIVFSATKWFTMLFYNVGIYILRQSAIESQYCWDILAQ